MTYPTRRLARLLRSSPAGPLLDLPVADRLRDRLNGGVVQVDAMTIYAPGRFRAWYADFEPRTVRWLRAEVHLGDSTVDVGAHIGYVAALLAQLVGPDGEVAALEPAKANFRYLKRNLRNVSHRTRTIRAAAGAEADMRNLQLTSSSDSHSFYRHPLAASTREEAVQVVRLDDIVDRPHLIVIDVEGAELEVLAGAQRILRQRPSLLVEWMPGCQVAAGRKPLSLPHYLRDLGYNMSVLDDVLDHTWTLDEVSRAYQNGDLPRHWYANLACTAP